jgi:hypothetical protein
MGMQRQRERARSTLFSICCSLATIIVSIYYVEFFSAPLPNYYDLTIVSILVIGFSVGAGIASRTVSASFQTAAVSIFSLLLFGFVLIDKMSVINTGYPQPTQPLGYGLGVSVLMSFFVALFGGAIVTGITESLLSKGPMTRRAAAMFRPLISYSDAHPGWITLIGIFVSIFFTWLLTVLYLRH